LIGTAQSELERKDVARRHLDAAESWLRRIIHTLMVPQFGDAYLVAGESGSCPHISNQIRRDISARYEAAKDRFPRMIDAADLGHVIKIILHPELYPKTFRPTLARAFPDGIDEARTFLVRLEDIRNKLAHGGTCSERDLERSVCYTNDLIDSLKAYFTEMNVGREFNVPTLIRVVDNKGNDYDLPPSPHGHHIDVRQQGNGDLHVGDVLLIESEVDPSFSNFSIHWLTFNGETGHGSPMLLEIGTKHVGVEMIVRIQIKSAEPWHRLHGGFDDFIDPRYRVLPPAKSCRGCPASPASFSCCSYAPIVHRPAATDRRRNVNVGAGFRRLGTQPRRWCAEPSQCAGQAMHRLESTMATMGPSENRRGCNTFELSCAYAPCLDSPSTTPERPSGICGLTGVGRSGPPQGQVRRRGGGTSSQKGSALLPPYTTGIVRIRSNLDMKLGRVIGGWQWRAADRSCASRCGHSSRSASGLRVAFVGALCRRIDSKA
jgi:hypothetical protein